MKFPHMFFFFSFDKTEGILSHTKRDPKDRKKYLPILISCDEILRNMPWARCHYSQMMQRLPNELYVLFETINCVQYHLQHQLHQFSIHINVICITYSFYMLVSSY